MTYQKILLSSAVFIGILCSPLFAHAVIITCEKGGTPTLKKVGGFEGSSLSNCYDGYGNLYTGWISKIGDFSVGKTEINFFCSAKHGFDTFIGTSGPAILGSEKSGEIGRYQGYYIKQGRCLAMQDVGIVSSQKIAVMVLHKGDLKTAKDLLREKLYYR